jgi:hypothetical protein
MKSLRYSRLFLAALTMAAVFIITEFIVEGIAKVALGITEVSFLQDINLTLSGFRYHVINLAYFYSFCCLAMWLYWSLLGRYGTLKRTVVATILSLVTLVVLAAVNLVNIGLVPLAAGLTSVIFNVLELTPAIIIGANVYSAGDV